MTVETPPPESVGEAFLGAFAAGVSVGAAVSLFILTFGGPGIATAGIAITAGVAGGFAVFAGAI